MFMPKKAVSVTLERDNLLWLRGQTAAAGSRSLSDTLDRLVTEARLAGRVRADSIRSVVGTIEIADDDPELDQADAYVRGLFQQSINRSIAGEYASHPRRKRRRG
jgi:hypothetical protein